MNPDIVGKTADFIQNKLGKEGSGHDWWHVYRVWQLSKRILDTEPSANKQIVELGALLHDIADWKFHGGSLEAGPQAARFWLEKNAVDEKTIGHIEDIVRDTSFKGAGVKMELKSIEAKIVFDADKLDSIGAIGIARTFAFGGNKNRSIYEPQIKPVMHSTFEEYKDSESHTINHFYEKLLLIKDLMQTNTGREMAVSRHEFMERYLEEFYKEWNSET